MTLSIETGNPFNINVSHCKRWMPSIDHDNLNFSTNPNLYESNIAFFKEFQRKNNLPENYRISLEFNDLILFFHLNDVSFSFKNKDISEEIILLDKEILSNTKSSYILQQEYNKEKQEITFPFRFGTTLEQIIKKNKKNRILNESDKLLISIQITTAMKDLYSENANNSNYSRRKISDRSFFIDYMKNAYLFTISDVKMYDLFEKSDIENQKARDIYTLKRLIEEIFKEINPSDELRSNQSYIWYGNKHEELNKFINKEHDDFDIIIEDLKKLSLYKTYSNEIDERLKYAEQNFKYLSSKKYSFFESILSNRTLDLDINSIYRQLFIQLRDIAKEENQYYLLFNLITHIFFPTFNTNCYTFDNADFFEFFDKTKIASPLNKINYDLLEKYIPTDIEMNEFLMNLKNDLIQNKSSEEGESDESVITNEDIESVIDKLKNEKLCSLILSELQLNSRSQFIFDFLKKVYFYYFPGNETERIDKDFIFDYFGILKFITHKDDLIYITHPTISDINLNRFKQVESDQKINKTLKNLCPDIKRTEIINIAQNLDGFDFSHVSHRLTFKFDNSSFYIERSFKIENEKFKQRVNYQDEVFTKIQSKKDEYEKKNLKTKYILHLDDSSISKGVSRTVSNIPFFSCTLNQFIQNNGKNRIIQDSDKILWAIQIASAFAVLEQFEEDELKKKYLFSKSICDQFFFIDSMKNIYLGALAFITELDKEGSTSNIPMYFRCGKDPSYVYKYGILLFEIFAELEPKYVFGNSSREKRLKILENGYESIELFIKYKENFSNIYGDEIGQIIDRCISIGKDDKYQNFQEIINDLKKTNLYKKFKYSIELREKEARPIDSKYNCSFNSLLLSSITGLRNIKTILETFFKSLKNLCESNKVKTIFNDSLDILEKENPQACYFDAINNIAARFKGNIDDLLSKIISREYYQTRGSKAIVIKENAVNDLGISIENMANFNYMAKMISEGIIIDDLPNETYNFNMTDMNQLNEQKVPILSFDYYLQKNDRIKYEEHINRWIYQIIYFLNINRFILSTKINSYELDLNDFALFYNNRTCQFDVDLSLRSIDRINIMRKKINVFSFARLLKQLKKIDTEDYDDYDDDYDDIESINQFITYCINLSHKTPYHIEFCSDFESKLNNGIDLFSLLRLFEKELRENVDEEEFNSIIDRRNYQNDNYKICYSKIDQIYDNIISEKDNPVLIGEKEATSGFYCFYEWKKPKETIKNNDNNNNNTKTNLPSDSVDVTGVSLADTVKSLKRGTQSSDDPNVNLSLIINALPKCDPIYIYKVFRLFNKRTNDTLDCLSSNTAYSNFDDEMNIISLYYNFPEMMKYCVNEVITENKAMIEKMVNDNYDPKKAKAKKKLNSNVCLEVTLTKEEAVNLEIEEMTARLKKEIDDEVDRIKNLNELSDEQRNEVERNSFSFSKAETVSNFSNDEFDVLKKLTDFVKEKTIDKIKEIYEENGYNFFKATESIVKKLNKETPDPLLETKTFNYTDYATKKYKDILDKDVPRTLKLYCDLNKKSYKFLIRRYIKQLNPKFNYVLLINIQNNKTDNSTDIDFNELERFVKSLGYPTINSNGGIRVTIKNK